MQKIKYSLIALLSISSISMADDINANNINDMFSQGKVSGEIRSIYSNINNDNDTDVYGTAVGGTLNYTLANLNGFGGGASFTTSQNLNFASGSSSHYDNSLSGATKHHTELTQAYLNYQINNFMFSAGRQLIDTPLADSDDIRMDADTFEAYIVGYEKEHFTAMAGYINAWQGYDVGLDDGWVKTAPDGVLFAGFGYESDTIDATLWNYYTSKGSDANNAIYAEITRHIKINQDINLDTSFQYLNENNLDNSDIEAKIYGVATELSINDVGMVLAYNNSLKQDGKKSFSGFGGGSLFTSMDTMILDEITQDRDSYAIVGGINYTISDIILSYAYGDFQGDEDSTKNKAHIVEQDIVVEYAPSQNLALSATYVIEKNKDDSTSQDFNDNNFRLFASYSF